MHTTSLVSKFMEITKDSHWKVRKKILRYVNLYSAENEHGLVGYTYSDWTKSLHHRKSSCGYVFNMDLGARRKQFFLNL